MNVAGEFRRFATATTDDNDLGPLSLLHFRDFLSREWRLIALMTVLALAIGGGYVATSPRKFTAQADMIIDTKRITWTQSEMASEARTVDDSAVESEIETTKSEKVAKAVIRQLHLTDDPEFDPRLNFTFNKAQQRTVRNAMSNTFGFGGHNVTLAVKRYED